MLALRLKGVSKCLIRAAVNHIVPLRDNACTDMGHGYQIFADVYPSGQTCQVFRTNPRRCQPHRPLAGHRPRGGGDDSSRSV